MKVIGRWSPEFYLAIFLLFTFFATLGIPSLFTPDEGRYAEIAREMLASHSWIVPHLDGIIYFEKPPLCYWITALSFKLFGFTEWAARIPDALCGFGGAWAVYYAGRVLISRRAGLLAAFILGSSLLYVMCAHLLITDTLLSFCLMLSLLSFLIAEEKKKPYFYYSAYFFSALAVLAKGLIGIVFPMMIIGVWMVVNLDFKLLKRMRLFTGLLLFLVVALPWHLLAGFEVPSFWHQYFYVQQFLRYTTPIMSREMPLLQYAELVLCLLLPWTFLLPSAFCFAWKNLRQDRITRFLGVWAVVIVFFFAFSHSVLIPYVLPVAAPLAFFLAQTLDLRWPKIRACAKRVWLGVAITFVIFLNVGWIIAPHFVDRSVKPLALTARLILQTHPHAELASLGYDQDYPFYAAHLVTVVDWDNELNYGVSIDPAVTWFTTKQQFWLTWREQPLKLLILSQGDYHLLAHQYQFYVLGQTDRNILVSNEPL